MPREATGELRRTAGGFSARITLAGRTRRDFPLAPCLTEPEAKERKTELARMALRLRRSGHSDKIEKLITTGAKARPGRPWSAVVAAVDVVCSGEAERSADVPTFGAFANDWTRRRTRPTGPRPRATKAFFGAGRGTLAALRPAPRARRPARRVRSPRCRDRHGEPSRPDPAEPAALGAGDTPARSAGHLPPDAPGRLPG